MLMIDKGFDRIYDDTHCEKYKQKVGRESPRNVGLAALPPPAAMFNNGMEGTSVRCGQLKHCSCFRLIADMTFLAFGEWRPEAPHACRSHQSGSDGEKITFRKKFLQDFTCMSRDVIYRSRKQWQRCYEEPDDMFRICEICLLLGLLYFVSIGLF